MSSGGTGANRRSIRSLGSRVNDALLRKRLPSAFSRDAVSVHRALQRRQDRGPNSARRGLGALRFAPDETDPQQGQLRAYKALADEELFTVQEVRVALADQDLPGHPLRRVSCESCGEGINDGRKALEQGRTLCRACADGAYYTVVKTTVTEKA